MIDREGSATILVLFLTGALMLIGSALWRGAGASLSDALATAAALQARVVAEAAVVRTVATGGALPLPPVGTSTSLPGVVLVPGTPVVRSSVAAVRVSRELYRIEAVGTAGRPTALASVAFLLWQLDPGARLRAWGAVAKIGGALRVLPGAVVTGAATTTPPLPWTASECSHVQSLADSVFPSGSAPVSGMDTTAALSLGLLDRAALFAGGIAVAGGGTPLPRAPGGLCDASDHWNWGSPTAPTGPCGSHRPWVVAAGDLLVTGGEGQGLLAVDGDVHFTSGSVYFGLLLASGDVTVDQGARVSGFVRAGGSVLVGTSSRLDGSACPALLALSGAPLPLALPVSAGWIDPF